MRFQAAKSGFIDRLDGSVPDQDLHFELVRASLQHDQHTQGHVQRDRCRTDGHCNRRRAERRCFLRRILPRLSDRRRRAQRIGLALPPDPARSARPRLNQALGALRAAGSLGLCGSRRPGRRIFADISPRDRRRNSHQLLRHGLHRRRLVPQRQSTADNDRADQLHLCPVHPRPDHARRHRAQSHWQSSSASFTSARSSSAEPCSTTSCPATKPSDGSRRSPSAMH